MRSGSDADREAWADRLWDRTFRTVQWVMLIGASIGVVGAIIWYGLHPGTIPGLN